MGQKWVAICLAWIICICYVSKCSACGCGGSGSVYADTWKGTSSGSGSNMECGSILREHAQDWFHVTESTGLKIKSSDVYDYDYKYKSTETTYYCSTHDEDTTTYSWQLEETDYMDYTSSSWEGLYLQDISGLTAVFAPDGLTLDSENGDKTEIVFSIDDETSDPSPAVCGNTVNDVGPLEKSIWLGAWGAKCFLSLDSNNGEADSGIVYELSAPEETSVTKAWTPNYTPIVAISDHPDRIYDSNDFSGYANAEWELGTHPTISTGTRSEGILKVAVGVGLMGSLYSRCTDNGLWQGNNIGVGVSLGAGVGVSIGWTIVDDEEGYAGAGIAFQGQELGAATLPFKMENWSARDSGDSELSVGINGGNPSIPWVRTGELDTTTLSDSTTAETNFEGEVKTEAKGIFDASAASLTASGDAYYVFGIPTFETTGYRDSDTGY